MQVSNRQLLKTGVLTLFLVHGGGAVAATDTALFNVTATVASVCQSLTAGNLDFGAYDTLSGSAVSGSSTISVTCSNGTSYSIALSTGSNSSGYAPRTMKDGSNSLNYNLYKDSSFTNVWGDGTSSTQVVTGTGNGNQVNTTVYGQIAGSQTAAPGSYSDTITVTITY